jgi:hypothetical protein
MPLIQITTRYIGRSFMCFNIIDGKFCNDYEAHVSSLGQVPTP